MKVYIGYDSREHEAYEVCRHSILSRGNVDLDCLVQSNLRDSGLYWRGIDSLASTEFSLTRFLVPTLAKEGYAIFCDCDFLFLTDINKVLDEINPDKAVSVVKHDYTPKESVKMDGCRQDAYPRKNWSSFMVFNCDHPKVKALTPEVVNNETPEYLHRFQWLDDEDIGSLSVKWNYLVGIYPRNYPDIHALHYTLGGPWFGIDCDFADEWECERRKYLLATKSNTTDTVNG